MVKKIISLIIMITITMMMTSHVFAQDTVFIDDNFEASSTENWIDNTGRGIKSVEGDIWNKYMVLTHKDSSFYNFQALQDVRTPCYSHSHGQYMYYI